MPTHEDTLAHLQYEALRQFIKLAGLKYVEFADLAKINRSSFQTMLNTQSSIKYHVFYNISDTMHDILKRKERGTALWRELYALYVMFTSTDDLSVLLNHERTINVSTATDTEIIKALVKTHVKMQIQRSESRRTSRSPRLHVKRNRPVYQSDKAIRLVCNIDSQLYKLLASAAEEHNCTFEEELEDTLYFALMDDALVDDEY